MPARELEASLSRIDIWWRHRPDGRLSGALPTDQDLAGRRGVPKRIWVHAEPATSLSVGHRPAAEEGVQPSRRFLSEPPAFIVSGEPPEGEDGDIACRHDVRAEPRPPELDERSILPGGRLGSLDARMDRQERRSRHAVLQAGPRRKPQGALARRQALVERIDGSSEG